VTDLGKKRASAILPPATPVFPKNPQKTAHGPYMRETLTQTLSPLLLSLEVAGFAVLFSCIPAVGIARLLARRRGTAQAVLDALCTLPLVLPPTVLGYYLILLIGRRGLFGSQLLELGIQFMFSRQGAILAASVVVFPLVYKSARAALETVDHSLEDAARTLGASEIKIFLRISLPLARRGLLAGMTLAFARGMGEFGATLMVAGNIPGRTQTLALAIYDAFQAGNDERAGLLVIIASVLCMGVIILAERLTGRTGGF
jgi:molybdate transport system permease protein